VLKTVKTTTEILSGNRKGETYESVADVVINETTGEAEYVYREGSTFLANGYLYKVTGTDEQGKPIFDFATEEEKMAYLNDNFNFNDFVNNVNGTYSKNGVTLEVSDDGKGIILNGDESRVYTVQDLIDGTFMSDLSAKTDIESGSIQITDEMRTRASQIWSAIYGDGSESANYSDDYLMNTGIREDAEMNEDGSYSHTFPDLSSEDCYLYSDENIYYVNMLYDSALAQTGNETAAIELVGSMWTFAAEVWYQKDLSLSGTQSMTSTDVYFITKMYDIAVTKEIGRTYEDYIVPEGAKKTVKTGINNNHSMDVSTIASMLTGDLGDTGCINLLRNNFSTEDYCISQLDTFVDTYGGDTLTYLVNQASDGSGLMYTNFATYIQGRYGTGDSFNLEYMMEDWFGGDANSFEVKSLTNVLDNASWIYEYYTEYAESTWFSNPSSYVSDVNIDFLSGIENIFKTAVNNAVVNNLGDFWIMDTQGTVSSGQLSIFVSPIEGIPSGIYSMGVRLDGANTLIDTTKENCFGIRGTYQSATVDYILSVNMSDNNIATFNGFYANYIRLADDNGQVSNTVTDEQLAKLSSTAATGVADQVPGEGSDTDGGFSFNYGQNMIGNLNIDFDRNTVTASGEGTRLAIDFGTDGFSTSGAKVPVLIPNSIIYGLSYAGDFDADGIKDAVNFNFQQGNLTYNGNNFTASSDFICSFANDNSRLNYGKYISYKEGLIYQNTTAVVIDEALVMDGTFNCNPFDYSGVMYKTGIKVETVTPDTGFMKDEGLAEINMVGGISLQLSGDEYGINYQITGISSGRTTTVITELADGVESDVDITKTVLSVGDFVSLGGILYKNDADIKVTDDMSVGIFGDARQFSDMTFTGDAGGHLIVAKDYNLIDNEQGDVFESGNSVLTIYSMDLNAGSIVRIYSQGGNFSLNVISGSSDIDGKIIENKSDNTSGSEADSLFDGILDKTVSGDTSEYVFNGIISNWATESMQDDFASGVFSREKTIIRAGSNIEGKNIKHDVIYDSEGNYDFIDKALIAQRDAWALVTTIVVAAAAVAFSIVTLGFGAGLVLACVGIAGAAYGVYTSVQSAVKAFQYGSTLEGIGYCALAAVNALSAFVAPLGVSRLSATAINTAIKIGGITAASFAGATVAFKFIDKKGASWQLQDYGDVFISAAIGFCVGASSYMIFSRSAQQTLAGADKLVKLGALSNNKIGTSLVALARGEGALSKLAIFSLSNSLYNAGSNGVSVYGALIIDHSTFNKSTKASISSVYNIVSGIYNILLWRSAFLTGGKNASKSLSDVGNALKENLPQLIGLGAGGFGGAAYSIVTQLNDNGWDWSKIDGGEAFKWAIVGGFVGASMANSVQIGITAGVGAGFATFGITAGGFVGGIIVYSAVNGVSFVDSFKSVDALWYGMFGGMLTGSLATIIFNGGLAKAFTGALTGERGIFTSLKNPGETLTRTANMIARMQEFNLKTSIYGTAINIVTNGGLVEFMNNIPILSGLDSIGLNLIGSIEQNTAAFKSGGLLAVAENIATGVASMTSDGTMWLFSFGIDIFRPILSPILQNMPGLGNVMKVLNEVDLRNNTLNTMFEEGFKESIPGYLIGNMGTFGEILQELFDDDGSNFNDIFANSASARINGQISETQIEAIAQNIAASNNPTADSSVSRENAELQLSQAGITNKTLLSDTAGQVLAAGRTASEVQAIITRALALELAIKDGLISLESDGSFTEASKKLVDYALEASGASNIAVTLSNSSAAQAQNYVYGLAGIQNANLLAGKTLDITSIGIENLEIVPTNILIDYANGVQSIESQSRTAIDIGNIVQGRYRDILGTDVVKSNEALNNDGQFTIRDIVKGVQQSLADKITALQNTDNLTAEQRDEFAALQDANELAISFINGNISLSSMMNENNELTKMLSQSWIKYQMAMVANIELLRQIAVNADVSYKDRKNAGQKKTLKDMKQFISDISESIKTQAETIRETQKTKPAGSSAVLSNKEVDGLIEKFKNESAQPGVNKDELIKQYSLKLAEILKRQMYGGIERAINNTDLTTIKDSSGRQKYSTAEEVRELLKKLSLQYAELVNRGTDKEDPELKKITEKIGEFEKDFGIPFAPIAAIAGFREGQLSAFEHIFKATIVDGSLSDIKGYAEKLQTAGGKSLIGAYTIQLLLSNPNIDVSGKMVTWLTNEDGNADDLRKHAEFIFGKTLGKVLTLDQASIDKLQKNPKELRKALEECSILITTYSSWSSLFSSSMASLLSYDSNASQEIKDIVDFNRELLKQKGIELNVTTKKGTTKVQFKNASQARQAIEELLKSGKGLENTEIPLDKISQMVGDEFDYSFTIPASALASAAGYFSSQYQLIEYYSALMDGAEVKAETYAHLGITEEQMESDRQMSKVQLAARISLFNDISSRVRSVTNNGEEKISEQTRQSMIEEFSNKGTDIGVSQDMVKQAVDAQVESLRVKNAYQRLISKDKKGKGLFGYTIQELSEHRSEDKGGYGIDKSKIVESDEIESEEARKIQSDSKGIIGLLTGVVKGIVNRETRMTRKAENMEEKWTQKELEREISKMADTVYSQYSDVFESKSEVMEMIMTGLSAYEMFALKSAGMGTGGYRVNRDSNNNPKSITITSSGKPVDNLNMPGMWVLEMLEGCDAISKPSVETFISSKEAIAAFEWSVGFSGTFSTAIEGIVKDLNFAEIGGTAASSVRVGVTTALVRDQKNIIEAILGTRRAFNNNGVASIDLIVTPNFDITTKFVSDLIKKGVKMSQVVSLSLDNLDQQIKDIYTEATETSQKDTKYGADVVEMLKDGDLSGFTIQEKLGLMTELLKMKAKAGLVTYIIGDVDLLGRGWNVGDMQNAINGIKEIYAQQGVSVTQNKIQATLWAVNFEQMDGTQYEQLLGRMDHRGGKSRFSEDYYHRDIVQITSVESARENKVLRNAAAKKGGLYSTGLIISSLPEIQLGNEQSKLAKAGNAAVTNTSQTQQKKQTMTYEQAKSDLAERLGSSESAQGIMDRILSINRTRAISETDAMSDSVYKAYENYVNYIAAAKSFGITKTELSDSEFKAVAAGNVLDVFEALKRHGNTAIFDDLTEEIKWFKANYEQQEQKINEAYQNMTVEQQQALNRIQEASKQGKKPSMADTLSVYKITKANRALQKHIKSFNRLNDKLFREIVSNSNGENALEYFGLTFDQSTGVVRFNSSIGDGAEFVKKVVSMSKQKGHTKLADALKKITVQDVQSIVVSANPAETLLAKVNYFGYQGKINKAAQNLARQLKDSEDIAGKVEIFGKGKTAEEKAKTAEMLAMGQAGREVIASIGTDKQLADIKAEDAKIIRQILDIGKQEKVQSPANTETRDVKVKYNPLTECVDVALDATKIIVLKRGKTLDPASIRESFVSELKAAGIGSNLAEEITEKALGIIMKETGHIPAIVTENITRVPAKGIEFIMTNGQTGKNHVVSAIGVRTIDGEKGIIYAKNITSDGKVQEGWISFADMWKGVELKSDGTLASISEKMEDSAVFKYEGLALVPKGSASNKGIQSVDQILEAFDIKNAKAVQLGADGIKMLGVIITAFAAPDNTSKESAAVWSLAGKNADGLAQMLGFDTFDKVDKNRIMEICIQKMSQIAANGQTKENLMAIELMSIAGGLLMSMKQQGVKEISELSQTTPKNARTITELLKKTYKESVSSGNNDDFVINVSNLQKAVTAKIGYTSEERGRILDVLIDGNIDNGDTKEKMLSLMKMGDIKAVAASA
jgi:hypothetical protein